MVIELNSYFFEFMQSIFYIGGAMTMFVMYICYRLFSRHQEFTYETRRRQHYSDLFNTNKEALSELTTNGVLHVFDKAVATYENYGKRQYYLSIVSMAGNFLSNVKLHSFFDYLQNKSVIDTFGGVVNKLTSSLLKMCQVTSDTNFKNNNDFCDIESLLIKYSDSIVENRELSINMLNSYFDKHVSEIIYLALLSYKNTRNRTENSTLVNNYDCNVCSNTSKCPVYVSVSVEPDVLDKQNGEHNTVLSNESSIEQLKNKNINSEGNPFDTTAINIKDLSMLSALDLGKVITELYNKGYKSDIDFTTTTNESMYNVLVNNSAKVCNYSDLFNFLNNTENAVNACNETQVTIVNFLLSLYYYTYGHDEFERFYNNLLHNNINNKDNNTDTLCNNVLFVNQETNLNSNNNNNNESPNKENLNIEDFI